MPGSLHLISQCQVGPAPTSTLFGGAHNATLAFRFTANSTSGANTTSGTTLIGWGTNAGQALPLAAWFPYTTPYPQVVFTVYGGNSGGRATNTFSVTVPIVLGVGYHFLVSWSTSTIALDVSGVLYSSTTFSNVATFPYQQVLMGGNAGAPVNGGATPVTLDHQVQDVAIWNAYSATAGDALALANGTSTPLQIGGTGACSAWWTLGGGTPGSTPSISDSAFTDQTGNSNTLSVINGALSGGATYATAITTSPPALVGAVVPKWGNLLVLLTTSAGKVAGASYPLAMVSAVNSNPTVTWNGQPIQLGPPTWMSAYLDTAMLAYQLQCGTVAGVAITNGGQNMTAPTVSSTGGVVLGTPSLASGLTGFTITNAGSFSSAPTVCVPLPPGNAGPGGNTIPTLTSTLSGTSLSVIAGAAGGRPGCGTGYATSPLPTVGVGVGAGQGPQINLTVTGGVITGVSVPTGFGGVMTSAAVQINVGDASGPGTGASLTATTTNLGGGTFRLNTPTIASGGSGYVAPYCTVAPVGNAVQVLPQVSDYIWFVPVVDSGVNLTAPPTLTVSDATGTGAVLQPIMSGVQSGDVLTYSAAAAWLTLGAGGNWNGANQWINTLPFGGLQAVTNAPITNSAGSLEPIVGGFGAFAATPKMGAGLNVGEQPALSGNVQYTLANKLHQGVGWACAGGTLTLDTAGGLPAHWTNPTLSTVSLLLYGPAQSNSIDLMGKPNLYGQYTLQYTDPGANTSTAMAAWLGSSTGTVTVTPVSQSGSLGNVAIPVGNLTITSGKITAVSLIGLSLGTGWQGAGVLATAGGGSGFAATVTVSGGVPTAVNVLCAGTGWSGTTTALVLYGTTVAGTTVTAVFDFEYVGSPSSWDIGVTILAASPSVGGQGVWTIGSPWIVPPDATTHLANTSIDPTQPYGMDANVAAALTTPNGLQPAALRWMDVNQGFGGTDNFVFPGDLASVSSTNWRTQRSYVIQFQYCRFLNTNPAKGPTPTGDGTYGWLSTKVYGPQSAYVLQDAPFTITGTLASGSATVTAISNVSLLLGSTLTGAGIPSGTLLVGISGSGSSLTMSQAATADGTITITVQSPGYVPLAATDNGFAFNNNFGSQNWLVFEGVSAQPINARTGDIVGLGATGGSPVPVTNVTGGTFQPGSPSFVIFVTSPYTFVGTINLAAAASGSPPQTGPQTINSTSQVAVTWTATGNVPISTNSLPYEATAQMTSAFPNAAVYVNLPVAGTDACWSTIGQKTAAYAGPTSKAWLEYSNEVWNGAFTGFWYDKTLATLLNYYPNGTEVGYFTSTGTNAPFAAQQSTAMALVAAHAQDAFEQGWVAQGMDSSRIRRVFGSQWASSAVTQAVLMTAQQYGFPVNYIAIGPYLQLPLQTPIQTAFAPAGSIVNAGSWPVSAVIDFTRFWMVQNGSNQVNLATHSQYINGFGQPLAPGVFANPNPGAGGGALAAGRYVLAFTFADSQGRETTVGLSQSGSVSISNDDVPTLAMPSWPTWAQALRIYLTQPGGAPGTWGFYRSIPRSQYGTTYPVGAAIPLNTAIPSPVTQFPPAVNNAAPNVTVMPALICYEGAVQQYVPTNVPLATMLSHDIFAHPGCRDLIYCWHAAQQWGASNTPNSGAVETNYYQYQNNPAYPDMWVLQEGTQQVPGAGNSNQFALIQGGLPADCHDHMQANQATALEGWRDWVQGTGVVVSPRRWASSLRRGVRS